jgi:hypothetical protein
MGQSYAAQQILVTWIGTQRVKHRPKSREDQIVLVSLIAFFQPHKRLLFVSKKNIKPRGFRDRKKFVILQSGVTAVWQS